MTQGCMCDCDKKEKVVTLSASAWVEECKDCQRLWLCDKSGREELEKL